MSDNEEFEEQIRLEQQAVASAARVKTKTDEDGTEYEWDEDKQAWFPRIDADFIAKYQLSYGTTGDVTATDGAETKPVEVEVQQDYLTYDDFVKFYYGNYREAFDFESHLKSGKHDSEVRTQTEQEEKAKSLIRAADGKVEMNADAKEKYDQYCSEYYKAWETGNYEYFRKHYNYEEEEGEGDGEGADKKKNKKSASSKRKKDEGWFSAEEGANNNIYISGLPLDITLEEFTELMNKAGMVMFDPLTKKPKLKLYQNEDGSNKGDGRCCYIKAESVDLALRFLDQTDVRGHTITVQKAQFTMSGQYDPKKRKKISNKQKKKMKVQQEKLFDWRPDKDRFSRPKNERTVVLKNMFSVKEFDEDPSLINEIRDDLKAECSKLGEVKKVVVYDRNTDGIATVTFAEAAAADACIKFMNKRWFAKKQISAQTWDGKTKYSVEETEEERELRLKKWEDYLEKGGEVTPTPQPGTSASSSSQTGTSFLTRDVAGKRDVSKFSESATGTCVDDNEPASTKFLKLLQHRNCENETCENTSETNNENENEDDDSKTETDTAMKQDN